MAGSRTLGIFYQAKVTESVENWSRRKGAGDHGYSNAVQPFVATL